MNRFLLPAVAVLLASCTAPRRDNALDPENRPVARLAIVDAHAPDGSCPALSDPLTGSQPTVLAGSRGGCFALDARGSSDPQPGQTLHFAYALVDTAGEHAIAGADTSSLRLDPSFLRPLPLTAPATFRVTVSDGRGFATADSAIVLTNGRPTARANTPRVFALDAGTSAIAFDGSASTDPDGDPLTYCWSIPAGAAEVCGPPLVAKTIDLASVSRLTGRIRVKDDMLSSGEAFTFFTVRERTPVLVDLAATGQGSVLTGVDVSPDAVDFGTANGAVAAVAGTALLYGVSIPIGLNNRFYIGETPLASVAPSSLSSVGVSGTFVSDPHIAGVEMVWTAGLNTQPTNFGAVVPGASSPQVSPAEIAPPPGPRFAVDSSLGLWFVDTLASPPTIVRELTQAAPSSTLADGRPVVGLQERPGTNEMWLLRRPSGAAGVATLEAWSDSSGTPAFVREVVLPVEDVRSYTWIDHDEIWLYDGVAPLRIDVGLLEAGAAIEEAVQARVTSSEFEPTGALIADPGTADLYFAGMRTDDGRPALVRVSADGQLHVNDLSQESIQPALQTIDPDGRMWLSLFAALGNLELRRSSSPRADQREGPRVLDAYLQNISPDPLTGDLWALAVEPSTLTPELHRVAPDGELRAWPRLVAGAGGLVTAPLLGIFRLSPDGTKAWGFTSSATPNLYAFDLTTDPPSVTGVAGAFTGITANSVLAPLSDGRAWISPDGGGATIPVSLVDAAGTVTPVFTIPSTETGGTRMVKTAVMPSSGDLCIATVVTSPAAFALRVVSPAGTVIPVGTITSTRTIPLLSMRVAGDRTGGRDLCWFAVSENGTDGDVLTVSAFDATGALVHSFSSTAIPGRVTGIAPLGGDGISLALAQTNALSVVGTLRFAPGPGGAGSWAPLPLEYPESAFLTAYGANGF